MSCSHRGVPSHLFSRRKAQVAAPVVLETASEIYAHGPLQTDAEAHCRRCSRGRCKMEPLANDARKHTEIKTEKRSLCVAFAALCIYICHEPKRVTAMERRLSVANEAVFGLIIMRNFEGSSLKYCTSSKYGSKPLRLNHPRSRPSILDLRRGNAMKREYDWL